MLVCFYLTLPLPVTKMVSDVAHNKNQGVSNAVYCTMLDTSVLDEAAAPHLRQFNPSLGSSREIRIGICSHAWRKHRWVALPVKGISTGDLFIAARMTRGFFSSAIAKGIPQELCIPTGYLRTFCARACHQSPSGALLGHLKYELKSTVRVFAP